LNPIYYLFRKLRVAGRLSTVKLLKPAADFNRSLHLFVHPMMPKEVLLSLPDWRQRRKKNNGKRESEEALINPT
jgi:hypothetical protein